MTEWKESFAIMKNLQFLLGGSSGSVTLQGVVVEMKVVKKRFNPSIDQWVGVTGDVLFGCGNVNSGVTELRWRTVVLVFC